ncbi:helix-turn-helix domain-containing protein [Candidatus Peregrinibacteria bacterium]|nr:helix-turn-helix domain-containing protein [Candidatus Peregrinibacteria bacterium]
MNFKRLLSIKVIRELHQFGLNEKEAMIYIAALEREVATVQDLAKATRLNRSTTHMVCASLQEKGFLKATRKNRHRFLFAENPQKLQELFAEDTFKLEMKKMTLAGLLPTLLNMEKSSEMKPQIEFYEGEHGFYDICERSLRKARKEILFISSVNDFHLTMTRKYDEEYYVPTRMKKKIWLRGLTFKNKTTVQFKALDNKLFREIRFIPYKYFFRSTCFIYENEFSMMTSHSPFLGFVVKSEELANTMKQFFEIIWNASEQ